MQALVTPVSPCKGLVLRQPPLTPLWEIISKDRSSRDKDRPLESSAELFLVAPPLLPSVTRRWARKSFCFLGNRPSKPCVTR